MKPVVLFRQDNDNIEEYDIAINYFDVYTQRTVIPKDSLVIPRYSALPFFRELQYDIMNVDSKLINSGKQFDYIANFEYYEDIKDYTFQTYFDMESLPEQAYVVKGKTNSRKHKWNTMCYAEDRKTAIEIACELKTDSLIGTQDIIFRKYEPLKTFEILLNELPVTNEWRTFFYKDTLLCSGYYWSNAECPEKGSFDLKGIRIAKEVAKIISKRNNFFTIDMAEKEDGGWIVVEVNSGEMSGLSMNNPIELYNNLKLAIEMEDVNI